MSPRTADAVDRYTGWVYIALVVVAALALTFLLWQANRLSDEQAKLAHRLSAENRERIMANRERIMDIQQSGIASCAQTYEGVRQVLLPLFPPAGKRTGAQQDTLGKLNDTVDDLKLQCDEQTRPGGQG